MMGRKWSVHALRQKWLHRAARLMNAVEVTMKAEPKAVCILKDLCGAVDEYPALTHVADSMSAALG